MAKPVTKVAANALADDAFKNSVIGTYEGEVLDTNITNKNGLDITREVMEVVFASDDYKQGIENGWFIGFLGHPEDPNCMDFRNACIVMTEGRIADNGKVYAKFNLIDTPVGAIVKKFIDARVKFGISIRGAGDITNNSVEPDTFVFRGFDLVSFPAYPESIPEFKAIAASTNLEDRKKYEAVCAAVKSNLNDIDSRSTLDVIKSQFAPQSEEYAMLEDRATAIDNSLEDYEGCTTSYNSPEIDLSVEKLKAVTELYLDALSQNKALALELEKHKIRSAAEISSVNRKLKSIKRITSSQIKDVSEYADIKCQEVDVLTKQNIVLGSQLKEANESNLIYQQKVKSSEADLRKKDKVIARLETDMRKTVTANSEVQANLSNLDKKSQSLESELEACKENLRSFQDAYAAMYASALGTTLRSLPLTSITTVEDVQQLILEATNTSNIPAAADMVSPVMLDDCDDNDIITM